MTENLDKLMFDQIEIRAQNTPFEASNTAEGASKIWLASKLTVSLGGLRFLTTKFLRGEMFLHFSHAGPVDTESEEILAELILLNEHGFLTECSQPGSAETSQGDAQRAFVCGFASKGTARRLKTLTLFTDLIVFVVEPGSSCQQTIPVTTEGFRPYTWAGSFSPDCIEVYEDFLSEVGLRVLDSSYFVTVIDPRWGRRSYLWEQVLFAVKEHGDILAPWDIRPPPLAN